VVFSYLGKLIPSLQVGSAVPDVPNPAQSRILGHEPDGGNGGAHSRMLRTILLIIQNPAIGFLDSLSQDLFGSSDGLCDKLSQCRRGQTTRHLACRMASKPITHSEKAQIRCFNQRVFVVGSYLPHVGSSLVLVLQGFLLVCFRLHFISKEFTLTSQRFRLL